MMRIGVTIMGDEAVSDAVVLDEWSASLPQEQRGHLWIAEAYVHRDAIAQAAVALAMTKAIPVATGVVNPFTRHPAVLAMAAATLEEQFPGRFVFGVGTGEAMWLRQLGIDRPTPLRDLGAVLTFLHRLWAGESADLAVPGWCTEPVQLPRALRRPVRTVVGGQGPRTIQLAAARADGLLQSFYDGNLEELADRSRQFNQNSGGRSAVGAVLQCFVTGPWLPETERNRVARAHHVLASIPGAQRAPVLIDTAEHDVPQLLDAMSEAGTAEIAFTSPRGCAPYLADYLRSLT